MAYYARNKNKIAGVLTLTHAYKNYIKDIPADSKFNVDEAQYKQICYEFNKLLADKILYEMFELKMPYRLGSLRIKKVKTPLNKLSMDFETYNKSGIRIMHLNEHTKGYHARWFWHKKICNIVNHTVYSFLPTRDNKRRLATYVKETSPQIKYFE